MKYLHALETGCALPPVHRLKDIFEGLTIESKSAIRSNFKEIAKTSPSSKEISRVFNEEAKLQFKWDIELFLEKSNLAFERWRYIYEEGKDSTWFVGYSEIISSLCKRITDLEGTAC
ncbi:MAG: hypothetical protein U1D69_06960 [Polynucleobacter sp.]|nr:hypothetical protein [Polynucleobacter sp.]